MRAHEAVISKEGQTIGIDVAVTVLNELFCSDAVFFYDAVALLYCANASLC